MRSLPGLREERRSDTRLRRRHGSAEELEKTTGPGSLHQSAPLCPVPRGPLRVSGCCLGCTARCPPWHTGFEPLVHAHTLFSFFVPPNQLVPLLCSRRPRVAAPSDIVGMCPRTQGHQIGLYPEGWELRVTAGFEFPTHQLLQNLAAQSQMDSSKVQ